MTLKIFWNKFPKNKILTRSVLVVLAFSFSFAATLYINNRLNTPEKKLEEKLAKTVPLNEQEKKLVGLKLQELSKDSDADGLKDWEEVIYGTNPQNPDTDQDGTNDGEEIKQNRSPLVKGPNDKMVLGQTQKDLNQEQPINPENNLTYKFLQNSSSLIGPYIAGADSVDQSVFAKIGSAFEENNIRNVLENEITAVKKTDLVISPKNDIQSVKNYFNSVYEVFAEALVPLKESDLGIMFNVLVKKDFNELAKLDAVILAFEKSFQEIKKIPVPAGYEDFAVKELNYLLRIKNIITKYKDVQTDPLGVVMAVQTRADLMKETSAFHQKTGKELAQKGIIFEPGESGYTYFQ